MEPITIVTGNAHKLAELTRLLPPNIPFVHKDLDLEEIQSLDATEIVMHKARQAYKAIGTPVLVEDTGAGLDALKGLPGPFIKFFNKQLGHDALYQLAKDNTHATASCTIGYYDGERLFTVTGTCQGSVVPLRKDNGFGFDSVFVPAGQPKTFAEMTNSQKDAVSHRGKAVQLFIKQLQAK